MTDSFKSATIKLTAWYLGILMIICLFFSVIIYDRTISEIESRVLGIEERFPNIQTRVGPDYRSFQVKQIKDAKISLFLALFYSNAAILIVGGAGSYFLARRTLEPIEVAHKAEARFIGDASHELRTPLAAMKSELEVALRDKTIKKDDLVEILESSLEEVNRLTDLSNMLLKLSRDDTTPLELTPTNLYELLETTKASFAKLGVDRIVLPKKDTSMRVLGDAAALRELFTIIFDNALRYSPEHSPVSIAVTASSHTTSITTTNSGDGIESKDIPRIFDRFYRGEKSRTTSAGGYGLGLSLAKKIALAHEGTISLSSAPGHDTAVTIELKKA